MDTEPDRPTLSDRPRGATDRGRDAFVGTFGGGVRPDRREGDAA
ncbi:hypothetical protein [Halegenticoccus tardaugens]|nr:hypothetical protein [Halegenticoccus tardaugens]